MNLDAQLLIPGCPLCDAYLDKKNIITKLHWPERIEDIPNSEFIIIDCKTCKTPMIIYKDHVTSITKEAWGRILFKSKSIFGSGITLRTRQRKIFDHFHVHVENINKF